MPSRVDYDLGGDILAGVCDLLELRCHRAHQGFGFEGLNGGKCQMLDPCLEVRLGLEPFGNPDALLTFEHDTDGPVGDFQYLDDLGDDADLVQVLGLRVLGRDLPLCGQDDVLAARHGFVESAHGFLAAHEQRGR